MSRAKAAIAFYLKYDDRHHDADVRAGENAYRPGLDARAAGAQLEIVEDGVVAECQAAAKSYETLFELDVGPHRQSLQSMERRLNDGLRLQERNLTNRHADSLAELGGVWGVESPRQRNVRERIARLEGEEHFVMAEVDGRPPRYGSLTLYLVILLVLAIAEVPVNRSAFELFFRETLFLATVVAILCGLVLVFLAHSGGTVLRQFAYSAKRHGALAPISALLVIFGIAAVLVTGLAFLRQGYVDFILRRAMTPDLAASLETGQYQQVIFQLAANGIRTDGFVFLTINVAMIAVGVIASYYQHDPHPDYERVDRGLKRNRAKLAGIQEAHAQKEAALTHKYEEDLRGVLRNIQIAEAGKTKLQAEIKSKEKEKSSDFATVHMVMRRRVLAYREGFCGAAAEKGVAEIQTRPLPGITLLSGPDDRGEARDA